MVTHQTSINCINCMHLLDAHIIFEPLLSSLGETEPGLVWKAGLNSRLELVDWSLSGSGSCLMFTPRLSPDWRWKGTYCTGYCW